MGIIAIVIVLGVIFFIIVASDSEKKRIEQQKLDIFMEKMKREAQEAAEKRANQIPEEPFFMVFDCETTGKPGDGKVNRIVQLAWVILDKYFIEIKRASYYLNPGKPIPERTTAIHGITDHMVQTMGSNHADVLTEFHFDLKSIKYLVAHNYEFDSSRVDLETRKAGLVEPSLMERKKTICTMLRGKTFCKITPKVYGEYKWPTLEELCDYCDVYEFPNHDALGDTIATAKCLEALINEDHIKIKGVNR